MAHSSQYSNSGTHYSQETPDSKPVVVSHRDANKRLKEEQSSLLRKREAASASAPLLTTYEKEFL